LISINWLTYVWGVTHGYVIETSLGYFIGPLVNVVLGVGLLSEKLGPAQWVAVGLAALGVSYLTVMTGSLPWIALTLAFSFATYGLIRKVVKVESLPGLATETLLLAPFAAVYLLGCESAGSGALGHDAPVVNALLIGSGPVTAIALFFFAYGTRLLPYSMVGVLQYITPTLQFICGVFVLREPFERTRAVGFTIIWAALLIYAGEGLRLSRKQRACA
jgi:chloramphenicol-sensitive protein RarD